VCEDKVVLEKTIIGMTKAKKMIRGETPSRKSQEEEEEKENERERKYYRIK